MKMYWKMKKKLIVLCWCLLAVSGWVACEYIHDDLSPCPCGLNLTFEYDYNLHRSDMFADHVGEVTVYVFDDTGKFLFSQAESGAQLAEDGYEMHLELSPGRYSYVVSAMQRPYDEAMAGEGADFVRTEPEPDEPMTRLAHELETGSDYRVEHAGLPLDTLWHGMRVEPIEVALDGITRDTVSLMRNTKQISVTLREIEDPTRIDVDNYDFRILDRNALLRWDNSVDETNPVVYTPYMTRNSEDRPTRAEGDDTQTTVGRMAHADFMTSRIIYHDQAADDAVLSVTNRTTGKEVIRINLADMLSRLRTAADIYRYSPQEFLDRGHDYQLVFFLKGDTWEYVNVEISVLSWSKRIQYETIGD